jgi:hypothetical protein
MVVIGWTQLVAIPLVTVAKITETTSDVCCVVVTVVSVILVYPAGIVVAAKVNTEEVVLVIPEVGMGVGPTPLPEPYAVEHWTTLAVEMLEPV